MKKLILITGTSQGIGEAIANSAIAKDYHVIGLSRRENPTIDNSAFHFQKCDVSNSQSIQNAFNALKNRLSSDWQSITMIHNAGIIGDIGPTEKNSDEAIEATIQTNLIGAMLISKAFINACQHFTGNKTLIHISSSAAINPIEGWSSYCASKAGLDHYMKIVSLEQAKKKYPVVLASYHPGAVDTNMQTTIRASNESDFPNLKRFVDLKNSNELFSPEFVTQKLFEQLELGIQPGSIINIRNL